MRNLGQVSWAPVAPVRTRPPSPPTGKSVKIAPPAGTGARPPNERVQAGSARYQARVSAVVGALAGLGEIGKNCN